MQWREGLRAIGPAARLIAGVPDYEKYLVHIRELHPDAIPMSRVEFFRDRQDARFGEGGRGGFRCC